jgi:hypothetical protein
VRLPLSVKQSEANKVVVLVVQAFLISQLGFSLETQTFMEPYRWVVAGQGLTTHFVQFQVTERMMKGDIAELSARTLLRIGAHIKAPV